MVVRDGDDALGRTERGRVERTRGVVDAIAETGAEDAGVGFRRRSAAGNRRRKRRRRGVGRAASARARARGVRRAIGRDRGDGRGFEVGHRGGALESVHAARRRGGASDATVGAGRGHV